MRTGRPDAACRPVLVVTGAAAAGKSTLGAALAADARLLVLDGDVLAGGAAAVADGARDYDGFWRYLLAIAEEVHRNALVPVFPCICLPDQVLGAGPRGPVHFLALVSNADTIRGRVSRRLDSKIDLGRHEAFDEALRGCSVESPHTLEFLDTTRQQPAETVRAGREWVDAVLGPDGH